MCLIFKDGKRRAYKLGQLLRTRYDTLLGDIYTPGLAYTQSTDFDRTKMSALLVLAGLFQPSSAQKWNNDLAWIPIPYHVEKAENDFVTINNLINFSMNLQIVSF